jgi:hypothetical protein
MHDDKKFAYVHVWITTYGNIDINILYGEDLEFEILYN